MTRGGGTWGRLARVALAAVVDAAAARPRARVPVRGGRRPARPGGAAPSRGGAPAGPPSGGGAPTGYPGDFTGRAHIEYRPAADGDADPGEVVWAWVSFEEDPTRGKDRPALVVARDGRWVLALMLTSRDHDAPGAAAGSRSGPEAQWLDIGAGDWDAQRRPSEVRLDRVLRLDPDAIRREGAVLDRARFERVADALRALHGWT